MLTVCRHGAPDFLYGYRLSRLHRATTLARVAF
jgi:hypothetical protein